MALPEDELFSIDEFSLPDEEFETIISACPDGGYAFSHICHEHEAKHGSKKSARKSSRRNMAPGGRWELTAWNYEDDMHCEQAFAIDKAGRLIKPDETVTREGQFYAEKARIEVWTEVSPDWLVLYWASPLDEGNHTCKVIQQPATTTPMQERRVSLIQVQLRERWKIKQQKLALPEPPTMLAGDIAWRMRD